MATVALNAKRRILAKLATGDCDKVNDAFAETLEKLSEFGSDSAADTASGWREKSSKLIRWSEARLIAEDPDLAAELMAKMAKLVSTSFATDEATKMLKVGGAVGIMAD